MSKKMLNQLFAKGEKKIRKYTFLRHLIDKKASSAILKIA
jgi:hypothetical protein